jgi:formylglycine-generating enzyme required for sulfatase activity/ligand-binding sensor domain-containing protein
MLERARCMITMIRFLLVFATITVYIPAAAQWVPTNGYGVSARISALAISPAPGGIGSSNLFAGTPDHGVYLSTENGTSWTAVNSGLTNTGVRALAVAPSGFLIAGTDGGVFISARNDVSWTQVNNGLTATDVSSILINGTKLYAGTAHGGIFFSSNNGAQWTAINTGLPLDYGDNNFYRPVTSIAAMSKNLYAGTDRGVYLSTNNGASWRVVYKGLTNIQVRCLAVSDTNLFAGTAGGGVFLTTNNGTSWSAVNTGLTDMNINALTFSPGSGGTNLFAGTNGGGVFLSTDNGTSWTGVNYDITNKYVNAFAVSGAYLFAGTEGDGVFLSTKNKRGWTGVNNGFPLKPLPSVYALSISPDSGRGGSTNLFAGTLLGVFLSTNKGAEWTEVSTGLPENKYVGSLIYNDTNLFAATSSGVFLSTNDGGNWTLASSGLTNSDVGVIAVSPHGTSSATLFAGTGGGVFLSTNNGEIWTKTTLDTVSVTSFAVNGDTLFAGTDKGIFLSSNNGAHWTYAGLTDVTAVIVVPKKAGGATIIAGRGLYGFWGLSMAGEICRSTDNGVSWIRTESGYVSSLAYTDSIIFAGFAIPGGTKSNRNSVLNKKLEDGPIQCSRDNGETWIGVGAGLPIASVTSIAFMGNTVFAGCATGGNAPCIWQRPLSEIVQAGLTDSILVLVAGGTFTAGTTPVTISSFKMDKFEVTYELWTAVRTWALTHGYTDLFTGKNGYNPVGANNPVDSVNWYDVVKWCNARSEKDGLTPVYYTGGLQDTIYRIGELNINADAVKWTANGYRLPTEAEWEFAARGGNSTHGYTYSGSNTLDSVAWFIGNSGNTTHQVGTKAANELGIYDMSGNVWEWCWDWWGDTYPSEPNDPKGPATTQIKPRMQRGGSFSNTEANQDVYLRYSSYPYLRDYSIYSNDGFRCVQGLQVGTAVNGENRMPHAFGLAQNYPNPFNPSTTIEYSTPQQSQVTVKVFDLLGREVTVLVNEKKDAGQYSVQWNASGFSSGLYFYTLQAGEFRESKRMLLIK